jgi:hypothetical protein
MGTFACRAYAIICFFYGIFGLACGAVAVYWAVFGMPPSVVAELPTSLSMPESARYWPWLGGGFLIFGTVFVAVGVFAYSRYISALIVGCLIWMFPLARSVILGGSSINKFGLINLLAFVLLTIIAVIAVRRSRFLPS